MPSNATCLTWNSGKGKQRSENKAFILFIYLKQEAVTTACTRALTFLRSFVAGKANFCGHLLASVVHFTVVKLQAILIIHLGVTEVIYHSSWGRRSYFCCNFISSLVGYVQVQQFCVRTLLIDRRFDSNHVSV